MTGYKPQPGSVAYRAIAHLESQPAGAELTTAALAEAIDVSPNGLHPMLDAAYRAGVINRRQKFPAPRAPMFWSLAQKRLNGEDHTPFEHRIVPAHEAPPLDKPCANSVFDVPVFLNTCRAVGTEAAQVGGAGVALSDQVPEQRNAAVVGEGHAEGRPDPHAVNGIEVTIIDPPCIVDGEPEADDVPEPAEAPNLRGTYIPATEPRSAPVAPPGRLRIALWSDGELAIEQAGAVVKFSRTELRQLVAYLTAARGIDELIQRAGV
jgi:hypothetical protein